MVVVVVANRSFAFLAYMMGKVAAFAFTAIPSSLLNTAIWAVTESQRTGIHKAFARVVSLAFLTQCDREGLSWPSFAFLAYTMGKHTVFIAHFFSLISLLANRSIAFLAYTMG